MGYTTSPDAYSRHLTHYCRVAGIPEYDKTQVISGNGQTVAAGIHYIKQNVALNALWRVTDQTVYAAGSHDPAALG